MNSKPFITVIIADDQPICIDGLEMLLSKDPELELLASASNGEQLITLAKQLKPDVVLTDLRMPVKGGVEAIREITRADLPTRCLGLSTFDSEIMIKEAIEAGAVGYVSKNTGRKQIIDAIKSAYKGQTYYCDTTSRNLAVNLARSKNNPFSQKDLSKFTEVEKQIMCYICNELTNESIGDTLHLSKRPVEGIRARIYEKAGVKTIAALVVFSIKNRIFDIDFS